MDDIAEKTHGTTAVLDRPQNTQLSKAPEASKNTQPNQQSPESQHPAWMRREEFYKKMEDEHEELKAAHEGLTESEIVKHRLRLANGRFIEANRELLQENGLSEEAVTLKTIDTGKRLVDFFMKGKKREIAGVVAAVTAGIANKAFIHSPVLDDITIGYGAVANAVDARIPSQGFDRLDHLIDEKSLDGFIRTFGNPPTYVLADYLTRCPDILIGSQVLDLFDQQPNPDDKTQDPRIRLAHKLLNGYTDYLARTGQLTPEQIDAQWSLLKMYVATSIVEAETYNEERRRSVGSIAEKAAKTSLDLATGAAFVLGATSAIEKGVDVSSGLLNKLGNIGKGFGTILHGFGLAVDDAAAKAPKVAQKVVRPR